MNKIHNCVINSKEILIKLSHLIALEQGSTNPTLGSVFKNNESFVYVLSTAAAFMLQWLSWKKKGREREEKERKSKAPFSVEHRCLAKLLNLNDTAVLYSAVILFSPQISTIP